MPISRLGLGGWQAGGSGAWGAGPDADDRAAIAAIRHAVERGVNWVDTAASYGLGHSEEVVRRALEPWRVGEEVFVFTKCGHPWRGEAVTTDASRASIRRECEGSLRRLGVDRIDLLQIHHADRHVPVEQSWDALLELVGEGKVRWAGVSNFSLELLERCEALGHLDSVQLELNLLRPEAARDIVPWCDAHDVAVLAYSPLASGQLVKTRPPEPLARVARELGCAPAAVAVARVLAFPGVTGAICGARSPSQADGWLAAAALDLSEEAQVRLDGVAPAGR